MSLDHSRPTSRPRAPGFWTSSVRWWRYRKTRSTSTTSTTLALGLLTLGATGCTGPHVDDPDTDGTTDGTTGSTAGSEGNDAANTAESSETHADPGCGDGIVQAGEECDGTELEAGTCETQGFAEGTLACSAECTYDTSGCEGTPTGSSRLTLDLSQVKRFDFSWQAVPGATHYRLLESASPGEPFMPIADDIIGESISITVPLHFRFAASYTLEVCNDSGCFADSTEDVTGTLADAIGYFKASNSTGGHEFGWSIALSADGRTMAVGAQGESSDANGVAGDQTDHSASGSGAVYVFVRDAADQWSQQAYVKASYSDVGDGFGARVALSHDGNTLVVGAEGESSNAAGIDGEQVNDSADSAGAAYVFVRDAAAQWSQQAYLKASNPDALDYFGWCLALSADGDTLAVSSYGEASSAAGIDGDQDDDSAAETGAVYVFGRTGDEWSQHAYIKPSNPDALDRFGWSVALSGDGNVLAVGAPREDGGGQGIGSDDADDSATEAGAAYVFVRDGLGGWSQQAYLKASNAQAEDRFGIVELSADGNTLAVGAVGEASNATGIDGNQNDDSEGEAGAVYVFVQSGTGDWSQQAYLKASNTRQYEWFGYELALSADGDVLAVGAPREDSASRGIDGIQDNVAYPDAGAAYVFERDEEGTWSQRTYVKASNSDWEDYFGISVALSADANTLAAAGYFEASPATGIGGDSSRDGATYAGAVYVY